MTNHNRMAALTETERIESLVHGVEVLVRKVAALETIPLNLLDRYERAIMVAHVDNLLRISRVSDTALTPPPDYQEEG